MYRPDMENKTADGLISNYMSVAKLFEKVNDSMLTEIQICHDHDLLGGTSQRFEIRMKQIAHEFGVNYTEPLGELV
jgi:hypothetical protein